MFKAILNDPSILKSSFNAISSIVGEVQIQVDKDGLRLDALDQSHILFVHLELKSGLFDEYKLEESLKLNVDVELLVSLLKDVLKDVEVVHSRVTFKVDKDKFTASAEGEFGRVKSEYLHGLNQRRNN